MDKWADQLISAVRYNEAGTHIDQVRVHQDFGDKVGPAETKLRSEVVRSIEQEETFCTITKGEEGKWRKGAPVEVVVVNGTKFIRTDPDRTASDNLGSLPVF